MRAGLCAVLVLALTQLPASAQMNVGEVVARLELGAPAQSSFILRGTLPVPPGTFPRPDRLMPLRVIDSDGALLPTQVQQVTSYANDLHGADVVEVLARVRRPAGAQAGQRITYDVILDPHPVENTAIPPAVYAAMDGPRRLLVTTRDVFGNLYVADLLFPVGSKRVLRGGSTALQLRTYGVLKPLHPLTGPTGTLPHMMGVHAYITGWRGEDALSIDLRIHNGPSGLDKNHTDDNPQRQLYFDQLELWTPVGWNLVHAQQDTVLGPTVSTPVYNRHTLIQPLAGGLMHVLPMQAQLHRRMVMTPAGNEARARTLVEEGGLGFARAGVNAAGKNLWSWWNPATARYFPQRSRLPNLDHIGAATIRSQDDTTFADTLHVVEHGTNPGLIPFLTGPLGWAHPTGTAYGGMTGGTEIVLYEGVETAYAASISGYRLQQLMHRAYVERQPTVLFNRDGEPTRLSQWVLPGPPPWVPMTFFLKLTGNSNDPFGFSTAPMFQVNHVAATGKAPPYEQALEAYQPIDLEHYVRFLNGPRVLVWLGNDALAKDDLLMAAELARMSYHSYPVSTTGTAQVSTMLADEQFVASNPGMGFSCGRYEGWIVHAMAAAYSVAPIPWRAEARPWFDAFTDLVEAGQVPCSGFLQATVNTKFLNAQWRARQSFEQAIYENALRSVTASVYKGVAPLHYSRMESVLERSAYAMISPLGWSASGSGPYSQTAVTPLDLTQPAYCTSLPPGGAATILDKFQTWCTFAYAYQDTGDMLFLQRATEMAGANNLLQSMRSMGRNNLGNRAALQAQAELTNYP